MTMNQNKLFNQTRWQLASWYALVMGLILSLCGLAIYRAMDRAHWVALNRELESVAGTLHDSIEPTLKQPGKLEPIIKQFLPDICLVGSNCLERHSSSQRHIIGAINQGDYYVHLFDRSGNLIAIAGSSIERNIQVLNKEVGEVIADSKGNRYYQVTVSMHTRNYRPWGYMQVGRSLKYLDDDLAALRWILGLGLPAAMVLIGVSSWWLAGLAMQPIYRSYQQIQQFTADAAHELRTPTAAIQATVESVLSIKDISEKEARDTLKTIDRQINRLSQLVKDMMLLCRMDRQAISIKQVPCCLNDLIGDLVEEFAALTIASNLTLTSEVKVDKPLYVMGDEDQLYRLVSNLIVNAIQYTPSGKVRVILESSDRHAIIHIQDTGIGIAPEEQKRIFDRFYRVSSDRSRTTGGSGLGLAIAMAIVQSHGGAIQLQSELGKGSTFTIRLPLVIGH